MNLNEITYDPSTDEILGVFDNQIHIKSIYDDSPVVLVLSNELFHKTWNNWIKGKEDYCKRWNEYCGIGGYTYIEEGKILNKTIKLYEYPYSEKEEFIRVEYDSPVIEVIKFSELHNFEHG